MKPNLSSTLCMMLRNPSSPRNLLLELLVVHAQQMRMNLTTDRDESFAAGTGFILEEPIKDTACNALSIFKLCDSTEDLERELDQVTKQQKTHQQVFQTVRDQNNEKPALFQDETRLTQESLEKIKTILIHIILICLNVYTLRTMRSNAINSKVPTATFFSLCNFTHHKLAHCKHTLKPFVPQFTFMEIILFNNFISRHGTHYYITPQFLLPTQLATIVQELAAEEFRKARKLTTAIPSGFEAIY